MIGVSLKTETATYIIKEIIAGPDRPNANVYLCTDENGKCFIAKHFYNSSPMANIGLNVYNHYGRRRDGSNLVFNEIKEKCTEFTFLVKHIERINYNGKWIIIQEYLDGITLLKFVYNNYKSNIALVLDSVKALAETLSLWHCNSFAHGDPHLDNAVVLKNSSEKLTIKLIDYCQIHHPTFYYCQKYDCFKTLNIKRINEDLIEPSGKLGAGFKQALIDLDEELDLNSLLLNQFEKFYSYPKSR